MRWAAAAAALTLACVLAVIAASASIRLSTRLEAEPAAERIAAARAVRKAAGTAAALGVLTLAIATNVVRATRVSLGAASAAALATTLLLAVVGFATGIDPPPAAAFINQFGGVLLAGLLGWIFGRALGGSGGTPALRNLAAAAVALCVLQVAFGGAVAIVAAPPGVALLILHSAFGLAAAASIAALACEYRRQGCAAMLGVFALAVPSIGIFAALQSPSSALQIAHAVAGAALLATAAFARARLAAF